MQQKKGGIFLTGLIIVIIIIAGFFWFIKNMNVDTDVNVDFSRKEAIVNQKASIESIRCLKDGFKVELELLGEEVQAYCVDNKDNRCIDENYYSGACTLIPEETDEQTQEVSVCGNGICEEGEDELLCPPCILDCGICEDEENCPQCDTYKCECTTKCGLDCIE
jgi:hypothetical protein